MFGHLTLRSWVRALTLTVVAAVIAGVGIVVPSVFNQAQSAQAVMWPEYTIDMSRFNAGRIISDELFFAGNSMTVAQIQTFLNEKVPSCRSGYTCLKDHSERTYDIAANPMCSRVLGGASDSAALIIWKVATACGVSPKVILVTLEKEQGLVTDTWPSARQYKYAMGADCPDSGDGCGLTAGFAKQVYRGTYMMKRYTGPPGTGPGTAYDYPFTEMKKVGTWQNVQYGVDPACGTAHIYISNQATHVLYVYTPYTPNQGALNAGWGTAPCGAYGNRNFFRYYFQWFGDPNGIPPFAWTLPLQTGSTAGAEKTGTTLRVTAGSFRGTPSPTVTYQWYSCNSPISSATSVPAGCTAISGATASSFTLTPAQATKYVTVAMKATNIAGTAIRMPASTARVFEAPTNSVAPAVSGTLRPAQTLTVSNGTWSAQPAPTFTYQWKVCTSATLSSSCTPIAGATASTLTARAADVGKYYQASVTAKNSLSATAATLISAQVQSAPLNTVAPAVTGTAKVGGVLTSNSGTWTVVPAGATSTEFFACTVASTGGAALPATGCQSVRAASAVSTLTLDSSMLGKRILAKTTVTNSLGSTVRYSATTVPVAQGDVPIPWTYPVQSGTTVNKERVGTVITMTAGSFKSTPAATMTYQWFACTTKIATGLASVPANCAPIQGATSVSYTLTNAEIGKFVAVKLIGTNAIGSASRISASTSLAVSAGTAPLAWTYPVQSGTTAGNDRVGTVVTMTAGSFKALPATANSYQWYSCLTRITTGVADVPGNCTLISGATSASFTLTSAQLGKFIAVKFTGVNLYGTASRISASTTVAVHN